MKELPKAYNPQEAEDKIYKLWEQSGYFNPDKLPGDRKEAFTITLPPPNVTGNLHIGHAYEGTLQDVMIRFERMRGKKALWVPGTDHAAIATQAKVEKEIYKKEKKSRHDLGREAFVERVTEFALDSQKTILGQLRKMGFSLDWSRLAFTLDEQRGEAVFEAFKRMYDKGLVYRGHRVVNWDPKGQTTVSDDEVIHQATKGTLYTFRYDKNFPIAVSSTRPETKLGDTAVAVHPDDKRYQEFVDKTYKASFAGVQLEIKIIADEAADPEFGTGAIGVTPAHSMIDWEMSQRHGLPLKQVIDERGKITNTGTELDGKKTLEAREEIVAWLKSENLLKKAEDIEQNVGTSERTGAVIEPLPKLQWFVNVNKEFVLENSELNGVPAGSTTTLKEIMRRSVESGQIEIMPEQFAKRYFHWIDNLRDWCISRQIWFGHRVPVWYHDTCQAWDEKGGSKNEGGNAWYIPAIVGDFKTDKNGLYWCVNCKNGYDSPEHFSQDEDTLDTWFSSGLWTFSTLGWPENTDDLKTYHPTNVMDPGYEILYLWVSRMILFSGFLLGQVPFKKAVIHGIVRDKEGRKFSKSSGIGGDPLEVTQMYGTDALRMALVSGVAMGNDPTFEIQKVKGMKHFANKLWNIARFVLQNTEGETLEQGFAERNQFDAALREERSEMVKEVTENLESFKLHEAAQTIYQYTWHRFADEILEESKEIFEKGTEEEQARRRQFLLHTLDKILKLLHPFMPFVTEEIWQTIHSSSESKTNLLMVEPWPEK